VPPALWRTWGNAALKRAQLRKKKLDEREELTNEAAEKYSEALSADPSNSVTKHTYSLFMHFKASEVIAQAVREKEMSPKKKLLLQAREHLEQAFEYKFDCAPVYSLWASYLEFHAEFVALSRKLQMYREAREARKIVDWLNICNLLQQGSSDTLYFGYGTKQGGKRPNWRRRFFVLTQDKLLYYTDPGGKLKGNIPLNEAISVTVAEHVPSGALRVKSKSSSELIQPPGETEKEENGDQENEEAGGEEENGYGYHITVPGRTYNVVVDHLKQRDRWTDTLYQAISVIPSRPTSESSVVTSPRGKGRLGSIFRKRGSRKDLLD